MYSIIVGSFNDFKNKKKQESKICGFTLIALSQNQILKGIYRGGLVKS